jgi:hypothetical protein
MKNYETGEIAERISFKTEDTRWCGSDRIIQQSDGEQHCYYCNFSLECGQEECVWHEGFAVSSQIFFEENTGAL